MLLLMMNDRYLIEMPTRTLAASSPSEAEKRGHFGLSDEVATPAAADRRFVDIDSSFSIWFCMGCVRSTPRSPTEKILSTKAVTGSMDARSGGRLQKSRPAVLGGSHFLRLSFIELVGKFKAS
jgi:hypothetical protein